MLPSGISVFDWMELLEPTTAEVLYTYSHPIWNAIPAVTLNHYGSGSAVYLGCYFDSNALDSLLSYFLPKINIPLPGPVFPLITKSGTNQLGHQIRYFFNFSNEKQVVSCSHQRAISLIDGKTIPEDKPLILDSWDFIILEEHPDAPWVNAQSVLPMQISLHNEVCIVCCSLRIMASIFSLLRWFNSDENSCFIVFSVIFIISQIAIKSYWRKYDITRIISFFER